MLLDFKSFTTLRGGRGWEAMVPQFTPTAPTTTSKVEVVKRKVSRRKQEMGGIWVGLSCVVMFEEAEIGVKMQSWSLWVATFFGGFNFQTLGLMFSSFFLFSLKILGASIWVWMVIGESRCWVKWGKAAFIYLRTLLFDIHQIFIHILYLLFIFRLFIFYKYK